MPARRNRRRRRLLGLRGRLLLGSLLLVCAPLVVVSFVGVFEDLYRAELEEDVRESADDLARELDRRRAAGAESVEPAEAFLSRAAHEAHLMVRVLDPEGTVVRRTEERHAEVWSDVRSVTKGASSFVFGQPGPPALLAYESGLPPEGERPEVRAALAGRAAERWRDAEDARMLVFYRAVPLREGDGGALYAARVTRRGIRSLYDLRFQLLRLTVVLALFAGVMGLWLGRRFVSPILKMQRRIVDELEEPRPSTKASVALDRNDEIGDLSRHFQDLADRLGARIEETAAVAGDLAHDIKNPIATVETTAELLEGDGPIDDARRERLARALADASGHMRRSVEGLLELARLDESLASSARSEVDLAALVRRLSLRYDDDPRSEALRVEARVAEEASPEGSALVLGAPEQLERLLDNLVDNALAFCRSRVEVGLARDGDRWLVTVADDGPGISPGNEDKVFRRFFSSRPTEAGPGTGLGLAIARRIAAAHGGSVALHDDSPLGGACFAVRLPARD